MLTSVDSSLHSSLHWNHFRGLHDGLPDMVDRGESRLHLDHLRISEGKAEDPTMSYFMGNTNSSLYSPPSCNSSPGALAAAGFNVPAANGFSPIDHHPSNNTHQASPGVKTPLLRDTDMAHLAHAMMFRNTFAAVDLAAIESSRPRRRNVKISKDPQSVAARHRRERISDRIRVLQRLVPGGTKMDTASMLDEAINYVKFLQAQVQTLETVSSAGGFDPRLVFGATTGQMYHRNSPLPCSPSVSGDYSAAYHGMNSGVQADHLGLLSSGAPHHHQQKALYKSCGDAYRDQAIIPLSG